jgi:hypothetical protein
LLSFWRKWDTETAWQEQEAVTQRNVWLLLLYIPISVRHSRVIFLVMPATGLPLFCSLSELVAFMAWVSVTVTHLTLWVCLRLLNYMCRPIRLLQRKAASGLVLFRNSLTFFFVFWAWSISVQLMFYTRQIEVIARTIYRVDTHTHTHTQHEPVC